MTNSKRKTPICGNTTSESEKKDKVLSHRRTRRTISTDPEDEATPPMHHRDVTNPWSMSKDGKKYFDSKKYPKLMRK